MSEGGEVSACGHPAHQVVLEGWLLKRGDRRRGWNKRYFVLSGNELYYYEQPDETKPKGSYSLTDSGCNVSDIYMHQRQKDKSILYCIKVTWWSEKGSKPDMSMDASMSEQQDPSSPSIPGTPVHGRSSSRKPALPPSASRLDSDIRDKSLSDSLPAELLSHPLADQGNGNGEARPYSTSLKSRSQKPSKLSRRTRSLPVRKAAATQAKSPPQEVTPPRTPPSSENPSTDLAVHMNGEVVPSREEQARQHEQELMHSLYLATKKANQKKRKKKIVKGSKIAAAAGAAVTVGVLTAGVGIVAGLVFVGAGAAAGGTGVAAEQGLKRKKGKGLIIASTDYEDAKRWKAVLDACLTAELVRDSTWGQMFAKEGRNTMLPTIPGSARARGSQPSSPREDKLRKLRLMDESSSTPQQPGSHWRPLEGGWATLMGTGVHGLRIFREEKEVEPFTAKGHVQRALSVDSRPCPPLKAQVVLNSSALNAFMCLMSLNRFPNSSDFETPISGQRASFRIIETIDDHMDVIHLVFRPLFLFPSWTKARDFVLFRYWRLQDDGTYLVCYDSVEHRACPPSPSHVRGEMHAVYTIAPQKEVLRRRSMNERKSVDHVDCLLTAVVQVEPRGWVPTMPLPPLANQGYGDAFAVSALLQILDIRDALDQDRFVSSSMGINRPTLRAKENSMPRISRNVESRPTKLGHPLLSPVCSADEESSVQDDPDYDFAYSERESVTTPKMGLMSIPPPLTTDKWAQPDANSFRVRGKTYMKDNTKVNAGSSIGRLIAVDVVHVAKNFFTGFCTHPKERMQLALERDRQRAKKGLPSELPAFIFCVNVCLPGPPCFHGVFYYAIDDMSMIDGSNGTPESKLANEFIFGSSDEFRHSTFKLIPQIVKGNFIVRNAVASTPAIMGRKLRQLYVRGEKFFEVVLDCGSSSVAAGVIRLALGYAKTMVIDMGFVLEGTNEDTLPEKIIGCTRIKELDFGPHLRFVEPPEEDSSEKKLS